MNEAALEELVPVVRRHAARLASRLRADRDDIESAAMWGLALGNKTFDPTRGVPYSAYCWKKVHWSLLETTRTYAKRNPAGAPLSLLDETTLVAGRDDIGEWEGIEQANHMLGVLHPRHRRIMVDRFVRGLSAAEIGAAEGCRENRISIICARSSRKMRQAHLAA